MPVARNGTVELCYDVRGPVDGEPMLLIMGLGAQLIAWRDGFLDLLVGQGFRVIRFDNRDVGLSTYSDGPAPSIRDLVPLVVGAPKQKGYQATYTFTDMATDAIAVLDAVGADRAHVVGVSLGGMVAQTVAIEHPERVKSLTSIMSKPGSLTVGLPTTKVLLGVTRARPTALDAAVLHDLNRAEMIAGPHFDRAEAEANVRRAIERADYPESVNFQLAAMLASGDRTKALRRLEVPTLVIHGRVDPLVRLSGGEATAKAVPGAKLVIHNDMGHDLPRPLWPSLTTSIATHARLASGLPVLR